MLKVLENFQYGIVTPKSFEYSVTNHRIETICQSKHVTIEKFHTAPVNAMDIDKIEERFLISGAKNGGLCIHDLQNSTGKAGYEAKVVCKVPRQCSNSHNFCINTVQFHPYDTGAFVSSGMDGQLKIWDTNRMTPTLQIRLNRRIFSHHVSSVATHREIIAVGMQYPHAVLLDPRKGGDCHELHGHVKTVPCLRWSPLSEYVLATGGNDGKILLWDVRSANGYINSFDQHNGEALGANKDQVTAHNGVVNGLRFTDDGLYLVSIGSDNRVRLWDVVLGTNTLVNFGLTINNSTSRQRAIDVCCSTNPPVLFVPSSNHILVFNLMSGDRIKTLTGHFSLVNYCLYRSVAHQLISGANDNNILLWTPDVEQEISEQRNAQGIERDVAELQEDVDNWSSDEAN